MIRMRKGIFLLFLVSLCFMFFYTPASMAHPPSGITMEYDKATGILEVLAMHKVSDPKAHFIKELRVFINSVMIYKLQISEQTSTSEAKVLFYVPDIQEGAEIEVEGKCNKFGSIKRALRVE